MIKPKWFVEGDPYKYTQLNRVPPLNLGIIAALSGKENEVRIVDEDVEAIEYNGDWDLVGITATTFTAKSAYKISENFRRLGVKTILGGTHPSLMSEEALNFCDSVVIGEAEPVWKQVLDDFQRGKLERIYRSNRVADMDEVPFPRRELFSKKYFNDVIQITRGCPNTCFYCYLRSVPWGAFRKSSIGKVCAELFRVENKYLFICDDNLFADTRYAKDLFEAITPFRKRWFIQAPTTIAQDDELLEKMAKSGCYAVALGFQSVSQDTLNYALVRQNKARLYKEIVRKIHRYGIMVSGFFIFGFDTEDDSVFTKTVQVIKEMNLDDAVLYILTPYPGTELFKRLDEEKRILNYDWSKYSWYNCNFQPKKMKPRQVEEGLHKAYYELNKYFRKTFFKRLWTHRKWLIKDFPLATIIIKDYFNQVNPSQLP